jgi:hypothetical protein
LEFKMPIASLRVTGLSQRKLSALAERAKRCGLTPERYVKQLVERDLEISEEARTKTFAEIMGPGQPVDEEELDRLVERARNRFWRKNSKSKTSKRKR